MDRARSWTGTIQTRSLAASTSSAGYAFANQPGIGQWNLARMAEALIDVLADDTETAVSVAQASLERFRDVFAQAWLSGMRHKIGLLG